MVAGAIIFWGPILFVCWIKAAERGPWAPVAALAAPGPAPKVVKPFDCSGEDSVSILTPASFDELEAIQELFDKTMKNKWTRDRDGKVPARFVVLQAQKNTNAQILANYERARAEIKARRAPEESAEFHAKTLIDGNMLSDCLEPDCCEAYLFHGTNPKAALSIAKTDFRLSAAGSNRGSMFGPGIYLAESSSKSDEYANDGNSALHKGICAMLLCRATLGKACFVEAPSDYRGKVTSGEYDCVIGDREKAVDTFREVVLFNAEQAFPEYVVLYRREMA